MIDARSVPLGANMAAIDALAAFDVAACAALASLDCANAGKTALDARMDVSSLSMLLCRFVL